MAKAKYQIIADDIKEKIITNVFKENETIPPELQLQKDYQVSRHTIRQSIAQLVNKGYLRKEQGSGTYVDSRYQLVENNISTVKTIGVITTYLSDYIFPSIIRGIESNLRKQGYSMLLASTNNNYHQEKECIEKMIEQGVSGLIIEPTKSNQYNPNLAFYVRLREQGVPLVMINAVYEEINASFICINDTQGGFLATEYLIKKGHERILLVSKIDDLQGKYRMRGFIKACEKYKIPIYPDDILTYETETSSTIVNNILNKLANDLTITGIVCYNDQIATILIESLKESGISVPEDISVIGFDNSYLSQLGDLKLTTFEHPKEKMGEDAANWITSSIKTEQIPENILYEPMIVERDSVQKQVKD